MGRCDVDHLARVLGHMGWMARQMPPAWRHAGVHHPVCGHEGQVVGRMLPGAGLYLDCDLRSLGITRRVRHVVERSPMRRMLDALAGEAAAITSLRGIQKALQAGQGQWCFSPAGFELAQQVSWGDSYPQVPFAGGTATFLYASGNGGTLNQQSAGALNTSMIAPAGSNTAYLIGLGVGSQLLGAATPNGYFMHVAIDALYGIGSIDASVTTTTSFSPGALTRYTSGVGVMAFPETQTGWGGFGPTAGTITLGYTNQAGAGATTPAALVCQNASAGAVATAVAADLGNGLPFIPLAAGDYGVRSVTSYTVSVGQGTGVLGAVLLYYPLAFVAGPSASDTYTEWDFTSRIHGLVPLATDGSGNLGCLGLLSQEVGLHSTGNDFVVWKVVQG